MLAKVASIKQLGTIPATNVPYPMITNPTASTTLLALTPFLAMLANPSPLAHFAVVLLYAVLAQRPLPFLLYGNRTSHSQQLRLPNISLRLLNGMYFS